MRESVARFAPAEEITDDNLVALFEEHVEQKLVQPPSSPTFQTSIALVEGVSLRSNSRRTI